MIYGEDPSVANAKALNLLGRAVVMRDEAGTRTIEGCTPFGQIISSVQRVVSDPKSAIDWTDPAKVVLLPDDYRTSAIYDGLGRAVSQTLPDGSTHTLGYDRAGNLVEARISTADGLVKDLPVFQGAQFNARNQRVSATLGNGVAVTHDFDPQTWRTRNIAARLTGASARTLLDVAYTYDPAGNIVYAVDGTQQPGAASPVVAGLATPAEKVFGYDALYQLRRAEGRAHKALLPDDCRTDPPNPGSVKGTRPLSLNDGGQIERYVEGYSYDLAGNLTKLVYTGVSASWTNDFWLSPTSNRSLPAVDANNLPISTPEARFDAAGNALNFPHLRGLFWNWRNALASCVVIDRSGAGQPNDAEYYVSDADNRRVRKYSERMIAGGAVEVTDVLYLDGCEIKRILRGSSTILERRLTHCSDGFGRIAQIYRWAKDDNARETDTIGAAKVRYQINDHLGSAHLALDEAGKVIAYEEYLPFGQTALMAGDDAREVDLRCYRFCGKERDDSTGLYYFGQRYYAVWMCRWISPDPAGFVDGINLYAYCRNNPVTYFDPDGLQTAQRRGQERPVYGGVPLAVQDAWSALPADRREQLNQLRAQGNFAWFQDESTGQVHFGSRSEIRALVDAKLKAGENVGNLHAAPAGAKPGQPEGRSGGAGRKSPPKAPPRPPPPPDPPADAGDGTKAGSGSGAGDPAQAQDGSQGNAKGAGDQPGDSQGKGHSGDSGGNGANPGDGGGDGSTPGNGGTGGDGSGLGAKGTGKGGGGTSNKVGDGTGGEGDRQGGGGTGASHAGAKDGEPGGHGQTPGGSGKVPGRNGEVPGGGETGTGVDPNGQPNGKDAPPASSPDGQTATGDPQGARNDAGQGLGGNAPPNPNVNGHGSGAGKPGGHGQPGQQKGSGAKGEPQKKTAMDYVTQVAGYWNLEFHGDKGGASGGVPGGFGSHNWGGWGQAIYVALTVADVVLTFLSFGGLKGIKAGLTAGLAAAKKTIASIGKKAATLFTEEFWSKVFARGLRGGINWNPFKSRSLGNFLLSGKTGRFSTTGSYETFFKRIKTTTVDFLELESSNGGRIFASTDLVSLGHVDDLANQLLRSNGGKAIEIITGRHGARSGFDLLTKEFDFLLQDYAIAPGVKNLVIHDASKLSPTALKSILEGGNDIILAWCHSENSRWVMKALGLNFMHAPF
jgi:RHS repeat-associated protein